MVATFLEAHNKRFACKPQSPHDAHVAYLGDMIELEHAFTLRYRRKLSKTLSCQYKNQLLQVIAPNQQRRLAGTSVTVKVHLDNSITLHTGKQALVYETLDKPALKGTSEDSKSLNTHVTDLLNKREKPKPPAAQHPWKRWNASSPNPNLHLA